jgi:hypothetical protein
MKGDESTIIIEVNEYLDLYFDLGFPEFTEKDGRHIDSSCIVIRLASDFSYNNIMKSQ